MTYVVALKQYGRVAILADMGVSTRHKPHLEDTAVKTGVLFQGCIYGIAGAVEQARSFLNEVREVCRPAYSMQKNWSILLEVIRCRPPALGQNEFQILLSSRETGDPSIFVYDSATHSLSHVDSFAAIGKGTALLDAPLKHARDSVLVPHMVKLAGSGALDEWPSLYCLWLTQHSLSQDYDTRSAMRAAGVAGVFHYIAQDQTSEARQGPAVLVLSHCLSSDRHLISEFFKIACGEHMVIVDDSIGDGIYACVDVRSCGVPDLSDMDELERRAQAILQGDARFFGFGFLNPEFYERMFFCLPDHQGWVDYREGALHPSALDMLEEALGLPNDTLPLPSANEPQVGEHRAQRRNLKEV